jgi:hypothetical protein
MHTTIEGSLQGNSSFVDGQVAAALDQPGLRLVHVDPAGIAIGGQAILMRPCIFR